jgi:hypothetical protein
VGTDVGIKGKERNMKMLKTMVLMGCVASMLAGSTQASGEPTAAKVRVGTYDSRSVAIAFVGSESFSKWMGDLKAENDKAKAARDLKRVSEIEAKGSARQKLMHRQGFSTAPVDNILGQIKDRLPAIKEKAGVIDLLSKWDKAGLAKYKDAELVDVTMALVDAFNPNDRQRKSAIEIQKNDPIPLEQAERIKD